MRLTPDRRKFRFGRRSNDKVSNMIVLDDKHTDEQIKEEVLRILHGMDSSHEYFEGLTAQLQKDGFILVKEPIS